MEKKKPTTKQLIKRIEKAIVMVEKTKDTKEMFFSDRGLRLIVNGDYAIVGTNYHKHVFAKWTQSGYSKPYQYTEMVIDLAMENNCLVDDGGEKYYSFGKLMETLKANEDKPLDYLIVHYYSMWLMNIFNPLYMIGDTESSSFMVFLEYCCNIAKQSILLAEHKEDMTNRQFIDEFIKKVLEFTSSISEQTILKKMTDEEFYQKEMEATNEMRDEEILTEQLKEVTNESKD